MNKIKAVKLDIDDTLMEKGKRISALDIDSIIRLLQRKI